MPAQPRNPPPSPDSISAAAPHSSTTARPRSRASPVPPYHLHCRTSRAVLTAPLRRPRPHLSRHHHHRCKSSSTRREQPRRRAQRPASLVLFTCPAAPPSNLNRAQPISAYVPPPPPPTCFNQLASVSVAEKKRKREREMRKGEIENEGIERSTGRGRK
jgi:hypothetical protein